MSIGSTILFSIPAGFVLGLLAARGQARRTGQSWLLMLGAIFGTGASLALGILLGLVHTAVAWQGARAGRAITTDWLALGFFALPLIGSYLLTRWLVHRTGSKLPDDRSAHADQSAYDRYDD